MKRVLFLAAAVGIGVLAAFAARSIADQDRRVDELEALRRSLASTRAAADSCGQALANEQEQFLRFDGVVDSLRGVVDGFEDSELGGVPEAEYPEYLELWQLYNDSVDIWQDRVDSLQASETRCRALIEAHNHLSDSIRKRRDEITGEGG